ncbi:hypothetical protein GGI42DRAFT_139420 [Trichoderma sp. SZMC 28013]
MYHEFKVRLMANYEIRVCVLLIASSAVYYLLCRFTVDLPHCLCVVLHLRLTIRHSFLSTDKSDSSHVTQFKVLVWYSYVKIILRQQAWRYNSLIHVLFARHSSSFTICACLSLASITTQPWHPTDSVCKCPSFYSTNAPSRSFLECSSAEPSPR